MKGTRVLLDTFFHTNLIDQHQICASWTWRRAGPEKTDSYRATTRREAGNTKPPVIMA